MEPERMFETRERLCWPRREIARLLDCSIGLVRRWENGVIPIPPEIGEWWQLVGRWWADLPHPPTDWRTRSARDEHYLPGEQPRTHCYAATTLATSQEHDMATDRRDWPGFTEDVIDHQIGRLRDEVLDREQDEQSDLREEIHWLRKEILWRLGEQDEQIAAGHKKLDILQMKQDENDKRTHATHKLVYEMARDTREILCHTRNAPHVPVPPDEIPF